MGDEIINFTQMHLEYESMTMIMIDTLIKDGRFDFLMSQLFLQMVTRDWVESMCYSNRILDIIIYFHANPFIKTIKMFSSYLKQFCTYNPQNSETTPYSLNGDFDDEKKMQAYDYFHLVVEQARLFRLELHKYHGSKITEDIYLVEGEVIKKMQQDLHQEILIKRQSSQLRKKRISIQLQDNQIILDNKDTLMPINQEQNLNTMSIDLPQHNSCNNQCSLF